MARPRTSRRSAASQQRRRGRLCSGAWTTAPDDSALMLRYRDGDMEAFEALYRRHNDSLYRYLLRAVPAPATRRGPVPGGLGQDHQVARAPTDRPPNSRPFCTASRTTASSIMCGETSAMRTQIADVEPDTLPAIRAKRSTPTTERSSRENDCEPALPHCPKNSATFSCCTKKAGLTPRRNRGRHRRAIAKRAKSRLRYAVETNCVAAIDEPAEAS